MLEERRRCRQVGAYEMERRRSVMRPFVTNIFLAPWSLAFTPLTVGVTPEEQGLRWQAKGQCHRCIPFIGPERLFQMALRFVPDSMASGF
jgi:hypothetical protein